MSARDLRQQAGDEGHGGDVLQREQARAQAVVDVVGVIGDVVGERRRLRLGAGEGRQLQRKQRVELDDIGGRCARFAARPAPAGPLCLTRPSSVSQVRLSPS